MRKPGRLRVALHDDHLSVELDPLARLVGMSAGFVVPFSTIRDMRATMPDVPGLGEHWFTSLYIPGFVARGRFISWSGRRRFFWLDSRSRAVLHLRLEGHPDYDEVVLDVPDPEGILEAIEASRGARGGA